MAPVKSFGVTLTMFIVFGSLLSVSVANAQTSLLVEAVRQQVGRDVPVPDDIAVVPPADGVSPELAMFSGAWVGKWQGERTGAYMADQLFVFEKITPDAITYVSTGIGRWVGGGRADRYANQGQTWSGRRQVPTGPLPLVIKALNGNTLTYRLENGKLVVRSVAPDGGAWVGTFQKVACCGQK